MPTRTRNRSTSSSSVRQEGNWDFTTSNWSSTPTSTSLSLAQPDVMTDVTTPGFRHSSSRGGIINSPMSKTVSTCTFTPADLRLSSPPSTVGWRNTGWGSGLYVGHETFVTQGMARAPALITQAITEAYAKVNPPDVDALVTLAEMRETLSFLAKPFTAMTKLTRRFNAHSLRYDLAYKRYLNRLALWEKRRASKRGANYPKPVFNAPKFRVGKLEATDPASTWLAYRYGLMPLIYEVQGYLKAFNKKADNYTERTTVRSRTEESWEVPWSGSYYWNYGLREDVSGNTRFKLVVSAGVMYSPKVNTSPYGAAREKYGLALHRVPSAAWEAVTLSFVVDWLVNVGDYLNAITASARANILSAWTTTKLEAEYNATVSVGAAHFHQLSGNPQFRRVVRHTVRTPASLLSVGLVRRVEMSTKRYADAAALIHSMLAPSRKR